MITMHSPHLCPHGVQIYNACRHCEEERHRRREYAELVLRYEALTEQVVRAVDSLTEALKQGRVA